MFLLQRGEKEKEKEKDPVHVSSELIRKLFLTDSVPAAAVEKLAGHRGTCSAMNRSTPRKTVLLNYKLL